MSQRGKYVRSPETLARMSESARGKQQWLGKKHTNETREKIAAANRRRIVSDDAGAIHKWLRENHPKTGICVECGSQRRTDYSYLHHPKAYTRDLDDYRELCRSCHKKFDYRNAREVMP